VKIHFRLLILRFLRLYLQYFPINKGKGRIWNKIESSKHIRLLEIEVPARLKTGAVLYGTLRDIIHRHVFFFGVWERELTAYYKKILRDGDVVIDIGANVGTHALLASHLVGPKGRVHAIEASPSIFRQLTRNLKASHAYNVTAYNVAVLDRPQMVPIFLHDSSNLGKTTTIPSEGSKLKFTKEGMVEGRPLSDVVSLSEIRAARLIKIDVEGAEWLVIKGINDILPILRHDVEIIVEFTSLTFSDFAISPDEFLKVFESHQFVPWHLVNNYSPFPRIAGELIPALCRECDECEIVFRRSA
jgi:FkbM family methyltransferase